MAGVWVDLGNASLPVTHKVFRLRQTKTEGGSLELRLEACNILQGPRSMHGSQYTSSVNASKSVRLHKHDAVEQQADD